MRVQMGRGGFCSFLLAAGVGTAAALTPATLDARSLDMDQASRNLIGSYLSGRFARSDNDMLNAAEFYKNALDHDPADEVLLDQAFQTELAEGNWTRALALAEEVVKSKPSHGMAQLLLGLADFKDKKYADADRHFAAAGESPVTELTGILAKAWVQLANGQGREAVQALDAPKQAEWAQFYVRYNRALLADVAGDKAAAKTAYENIFGQDSRALRTSLAYARRSARFGETKLARSILRETVSKSQGEEHPLVKALRDEIESGRKVELLVSTPAEGLAEVLYGLGSTLAGEGGLSIGMRYLQLALFVEPKHPFALEALGGALESSRRYKDAIAVYDTIPPSAAMQSSIDIRKAFALNSLDRSDEAVALLEKLAAADANDVRPLDAAGNILRSRKKFSEATDYFSRAIRVVKRPEKRHWALYYSRGTCYERSQKWPQAEADLKTALKLYPEQPQVLNYLGYSWVDQDRRLREGIGLIEKAVMLKPDDGYIVDSLGWAHYKLGNYKEAVRFLERAVELKPDDPVLNDHLGDALWRVGREREARYQWEQSISLSPEAEELAKIKRKLEQGLPPKVQAKPAKKTREVGRSEKRKQSKLERPKPFFE